MKVDTLDNSAETKAGKQEGKIDTLEVSDNMKLLQQLEKELESIYNHEL